MIQKHTHVAKRLWYKGNGSKGASRPENVQTVRSECITKKNFCCCLKCFASNFNSWGRSHIGWLLFFFKVFFKVFTNEEQKKVDSWRISDFCHLCRRCLWRHWYRTLGTKYCRVFATFKRRFWVNRTTKSSEKLRHIFYLYRQGRGPPSFWLPLKVSS